MPNRNDFKSIARIRLREARALFDKGLYDGAVYLSGYVVEAALKARICKILNRDYPDSGKIASSFLTHDFDTLIKLGGLEQKLIDYKAINANFDANWSIATGWKETKRYDTIGTNTRINAIEIINALEDDPDGVFTWIKSLW